MKQSLDQMWTILDSSASVVDTKVRKEQQANRKRKSPVYELRNSRTIATATNFLAKFCKNWVLRFFFLPRY